jgi:hypothetical protein
VKIWVTSLPATLMASMLAAARELSPPAAPPAGRHVSRTALVDSSPGMPRDPALRPRQRTSTGQCS